jgi:hypothetical protein
LAEELDDELPPPHPDTSNVRPDRAATRKTGDFDHVVVSCMNISFSDAPVPDDTGGD